MSLSDRMREMWARLRHKPAVTKVAPYPTDEEEPTPPVKPLYEMTDDERLRALFGEKARHIPDPE